MVRMWEGMPDCIRNWWRTTLSWRLAVELESPGDGMDPVGFWTGWHLAAGLVLLGGGDTNSGSWNSVRLAV